jgi:hypothetical protein
MDPIPPALQQVLYIYLYPWFKCLQPERRIYTYTHTNKNTIIP